MASLRVRHWVLATAAGELVGFLGPTFAGAAIFVLLGEGPVGAIVGHVAATVGGFGEGAAVGWAQGRALRRRWAVDPRRLAVATGTAAAAAWAVGMAPSTLFTLWPGLSPWALLPLAPLVLLALLGLGWAQARALRALHWPTWRWTWWTALAWALGVALPVLALSLIPDGTALALRVVTGVAAAVAMGVVVGLVTAVPLAGLLRGPA